MPAKQPPPLTDKTKTVLRAVLAESGRTAAGIARQVGLPPTVTASLLARLINIGVVTDYRHNSERVYRIAAGAEQLAADAADVPAPIKVPDQAPAPAGPRPERGVWRLRDLRAAVDRGDMPRGLLDAAERALAPPGGSVTRPGKSDLP